MMNVSATNLEGLMTALDCWTGENHSAETKGDCQKRGCPYVDMIDCAEGIMRDAKDWISERLTAANPQPRLTAADPQTTGKNHKISITINAGAGKTVKITVDKEGEAE